MENILTKAIPEAKNRVEILVDNGFKELKEMIKGARKYYYIRSEKE
jgi:hypothetical protein